MLFSIHYNFKKSKYEDRKDSKEKGKKIMRKKFTSLFTAFTFTIILFGCNDIEEYNKNILENSNPEIFPWISDVMIIEQFRGKGYGKALIQSAKDFLKKLGYETIYVWTDQAPDFYKKLGFTYLQEVEKNEGGFGKLFYMK